MGMTKEEAIKVITEIMKRPHIDSMTNRRIDDALAKAIEVLQDKIEYDKKQSNW